MGGVCVFWAKEEPPRCGHKGGVFGMRVCNKPEPTKPGCRPVTAGAFGQRYIFPRPSGCKTLFTSIWGTFSWFKLRTSERALWGRKMPFLGEFRHFCESFQKWVKRGTCQNSYYSQVNAQERHKRKTRLHSPQSCGLCGGAVLALGGLAGG